MKLTSLTKGLLIAAAASVAVVTSQAALAKPVEIKFSHVVAENTPKGKMANRFKELVKERLGDDKAIVKVFPNKQLYGDGKVLEAMLLGDVELAAPSLSKFKKYTKKLQLFDLPFLFKNAQAAANFLEGPNGDKLLSSLDSKGFKGLGYLNNGMKQLSSSKKMVVPSDAAGLKFRIMGSDVLQAQFEAVSATPLKKPFSEVFTLLQTKAIDGQENTWSNIYSKKFYEVQPFIMDSNHGYLGYLVVTSAEFWSALPEDIRSVVKTSLDEAIAVGNEQAKVKAVSDRQAVIDAGTSEVYSISDAERQQWVDIMKPVWQKFEAEIGVDMIKAASTQN
jgi:C4-dicarboxylate-binding protein DctP